MTAADLARAAGVSKATISSVERGFGNPAVDTVWALAQALNLPFGALFETVDNDVVQVQRLADAPVVSQEAGFLGRQLMTLARHGQLELYVLELESGAHRSAAPHPAGVIEHIIVVSGEAEVGPEESPSMVAPGDYVRFHADRPHHYRAITEALLLSLTEYPA
jgi:transcriptional regulator with XRE-family HTH domain